MSEEEKFSMESESAEQEEINADVQLFEHNRRFQAAVLRTMEKQMAQMEEITFAKERALEGSEKAREDLALSWAEMKKELTRMNKSYEKASSDLRKSQHNQKTVTNENLHLKAELGNATKGSKETQDELARLRQELASTREELHAGKQLHQIFSSDITMHRQLKENLNSEMRILQTDLKKSNAQGEELHAKWEKSQAEITALKGELSNQCGETQKAQAEVERVVHELNLLRASREVMTRQWEGALTAMHKRDGTMANVAAARDAATNEALALKNAESNLLNEVQLLRKQTNEMTAALNEERKKLSDASYAHSELKKAHDEAQRLLEIAAVEKSTADLNLTSLTKTNGILELENQRLKVKAAQSSDQSKFDQNQLREQKVINAKIDHNIATTENAMLAKSEKENDDLKHRVIQLEYEKQLEANKAIELAEQLKELSRSNAILNEEFVNTSQRYETAVNEMKSVQIQLDHMTYRANKAESEALHLRTTKEEERRSEQSTLQGNIHHLESELKHKADEVAKMNHAYVLAEEKVLEAHRLHSEISGKTDRLKSELRKAEGVKDRLKHTIDTLSAENINILKENNEQRLTVRKHENVIYELNQENVVIKGKLADAALLQTKREAEYGTELATVKAELVRMRQTRAGAVETLEFSEREKGLWERKHEMLTLKYTGLQSEFEKMKTAYFAAVKELKSHHKETTVQEKQFATWMKNFEQMFERQTNQMANGKKKSSSNQGVGGAGPKLSFSSSQQLTAKQVLENFHMTAASLPPNSATFTSSSSNAAIPPPHLSKAGASIIGNSGGGGSNHNQVPALNLTHASGSSPALDSLNDMMALMQRNGVSMSNIAALTGSASARTLSDSDSKSSLLNREGAPGGGGTGKRSSTFTEQLVQELRAALHKASTLAAERLTELTKVKQELKVALQSANEAAAREGSLLTRVHQLSTETQSLSTNLLLSHRAYAKAENMCASLERQLRQAQQELMGALSTGSFASSHSSDVGGSAIRQIDYSYHNDLEPSPRLKAVLQVPSSNRASIEVDGLLDPQNDNSSMVSLTKYFSSASQNSLEYQAQPAQTSPYGFSAPADGGLARKGRSGQRLSRPSQATLLATNANLSANSSSSSTSALKMAANTTTTHPLAVEITAASSGLLNSPSQNTKSEASLLHSNKNGGGGGGGGGNGLAGSASVATTLSLHSSFSASQVPTPSGHHTSSTMSFLSPTASTVASNQNSFSNLPISIQPAGAAPHH